MFKATQLSLNFILSTGRTGSTLLSTMLNMHPNIVSTAEEPFAYNLFPKYKNKTTWTDELISEYCADFFLFSAGKLEPQFGTKDDLFNILKKHQKTLTGELAIKLTYLAFFPEKDKTQVTTLVDKELKPQFVFDNLQKYYPEAKFIVLTRDPRDNSLIKNKRDIKKKQYRSYYAISRIWEYEYSNLLQKISKINPNRYIIVRYEDLVTEPKKTLSTICEFLSLPYNPILLEYDTIFNDSLKKNRDSLDQNTVQHLSNFHSSLGNRVNKDKVGLWKKEISEKDQNLIWWMCHKTAIKLGYTADGCVTKHYFNTKMMFEAVKFLLLIRIYSYTILN